MNPALALDTESLKLIQETAVKAAGTEVKNRVCVRDTLPDKTKWLLIDKEGNSTLLDVSQPLRLHKLLSVQEVVAFARFAKADLGSSPIVWIGEQVVTVTLDDRRLFADRAIYSFRPTGEWLLIDELTQRMDGHDQKKFLRLLRVDLAECFARDDQRLLLINNVRKVRAQQSTNLGNGSGSYDATLASSSDTAIDWPDNLDLLVRLFDDPALTLREPIRCAFDVEPMPPRFVLSPLTAHIARALGNTLELASQTIRAELKDEIPVFLGQPE